MLVTYMSHVTCYLSYLHQTYKQGIQNQMRVIRRPLLQLVTHQSLYFQLHSNGLDRIVLSEYLFPIVSRI